MGMKLEDVKKDRWWVELWSYERKSEVELFFSMGEEDLELEDVKPSLVVEWDCLDFELVIVQGSTLECMHVRTHTQIYI